MQEAISGTVSIQPIAIQRSIATKIFGVAAVVLVMTITLTCFLLWEISRTEKAMRVVSAYDLPLTQAITNIDYTALRRRLAFERWFGALNAENPNQTVVAEASANYDLYATQLREEAASLKDLLANYPVGDGLPEQLIQVQMLFDNLLDIYPVMTKQMMATLALQQNGERQQANEQLNLLIDLQNSVQAMREKMSDKMSELSAESADRVTAQQQYTLWIALAATVSALFLGLLVAWIIASNLTRPIRALVTAMSKARHGELDMEKLPVCSRDEVGQLTDTFNYFLEELRAKEMIKRTFGKYIDPRVLERVLLTSGDEVESINRRVMSVSFADIVGFSGLSERLTPAAMVAVLNRHFELQAQMVHEHQGIVDKFIGDAVMTFWGPPFVQPEQHALLACRAALAQIAIINTLRTELPDITGLRKDTPQIDLRVGICTGGVVVGNIGSDTARSYTVIGDTVNIASRLEGANRLYGTRIMISDTTREAIGTAFEVRELDLITVKGRSEPTRIYELLGATDAVAAQILKLRDTYTRGLSAYRSQDWETAEQAFAECLIIQPDDKSSDMFLERIKQLRITPPSNVWNGVWHMTDK
ncbi:MAG TPA: adenylate/guanylate cyclase domain-containing protein [Pseudomonadales bacterium]|nr:adenylate/guanylate cyclase domain-containing protein [Pseudomonadales bacterium]